MDKSVKINIIFQKIEKLSDFTDNIHRCIVVSLMYRTLSEGIVAFGCLLIDKTLQSKSQ